MSLPRVSDVDERLCPKCGMLQESPGSTVCEQCGTDLISGAQPEPAVSTALPATYAQPAPTRPAISTPAPPVAVSTPAPPVISTPPPAAVSSPRRLKVNWSRRPSVPSPVVNMQHLATSLDVAVRRIGPILARTGPVLARTGSILVRPIGPVLLAPIRALVAIPVMLLRGTLAVVHRVLSIIVDSVALALRAAVVVLAVGSLVIGLSYVPAVRAALPITKEVTVRADPWLQQAEDLRGRLLTQLHRSVLLRRWPQRSPDARAAGHARPTATPKPAPSSRRTPSAVSVVVQSTPPGATVLLDHRRAGKAPLTLRVKPGTYRLTVSHPGYLSETRTVTVRAGQPISLDVVLNRPP